MPKVTHAALEPTRQFVTISDHQHSRVRMARDAALALELHNICALQPPEDDADDDHEEDYQAAHETAHPLRPRQEIGGEGSIDCQRGGERLEVAKKPRHPHTHTHAHIHTHSHTRQGFYSGQGTPLVGV
jgi:hypothetical protein